MAKITPEGIVPTLLTEYKDELISLYQAIDPEWVLDSNSPDGQFVIAVATMLSRLDKEAVKSFNYRDVRQAIDSALEDLCSHQDIQREQARQSKIKFDLIGVNGTLVNKNTQIKNKQTNSVWSLDSDSTVGSQGAFTSLDTGYISADDTSQDQFEVVNPTPGFYAVTNPQDFEIGRTRESNEQMRSRRKNVVSRPGSSKQDAIKSNLYALDGVIDCDVIDYIEQPEKESKIEVIVLGGEPMQIAEIIYKKRSLGVPTVGTIENTVFTDLNPNGFPIRFNRPVMKSVFVRITMAGVNQITNDEKQEISDTIVAYSKGELEVPYLMNQYGFKIGQDPSSGLIYSPVNFRLGQMMAVNDQIYVKKIELSLTGNDGDWSDVVSIKRNELSSFESSNIEYQ